MTNTTLKLFVVALLTAALSALGANAQVAQGDTPSNDIQDFINKLEEQQKGLEPASNISRISQKSEGANCLPYNIIFLLDQSSSVNSVCETFYSKAQCTKACGVYIDPADCILDNFGIETNFVKLTINNLAVSKEKTHVGMISFSSKNSINLFQRLDNKDSYNLTNVNKTLNELPYKGGLTATRLALQTAYEHLIAASNAENGTRYGQQIKSSIVLITDGMSNDGVLDDNRDDPVPLAKKIISEDIEIISVGVGSTLLNRTELKGIASQPDNFLIVKNFESLESLTQLLSTMFCTGTTDPSKYNASDNTFGDSKNDLKPLNAPITAPVKASPYFPQNPTSLSTGGIIGIVLASVIVAIACIIIGFYYYKRRQDMLESDKFIEEANGKKSSFKDSNPLYNTTSKQMESSIYRGGSANNVGISSGPYQKNV